MSLTGPLYSTIYSKIQRARPTGTTTRVMLLQQKLCVVVCPPGLYHVGLLGRSTSTNAEMVFEHGPVAYDSSRVIEQDTIIVPLPSVRHSLAEIEAFQQTLPKTYVVGIRDCRHHVLDLLEFLYD